VEHIRMSNKIYVIAGRAFSVALAFASGVLLVGGTKLLTLGGSWWYVSAGAVLLASAVLLWRKNRWGLWLYGFLLLVTLIWSLWEVGLDAWGLLPRLGLLVAGGLWLLTPLGYGALHAGPDALLGPRARTVVWTAIAVSTIMLLSAALAGVRAPSVIGQAQLADAAATARDWRYYGNDSNGTRYAPLAQIRPANVAKLTLAWTARTGELPAPGAAYNFEATPLQVGRLVYVCTSKGRVIAFDAANGQRAWHFDPHADLTGWHDDPCRGVAYGEQDVASGGCAHRIYTVAPDNNLWALDALTGESCMDFGHNGAVDLRQGLGEVPKGSYQVTSPPLVTHGRVVIGAKVADNLSIDVPSGVVRAYDVRSGEMAWAWDVGRPDRSGAPGPGESYTRSTPNVWAPMVADDAAGLIYLPTGNPASDFYGGGRREFDEAFSTSLVAVEADTGLTRWKFQTTHHDVWDFDLASQPTLFDMPGPRGMQPAIAFGSKSGSIYVLNRLTGKPIVGVVERPVPHDSSVETALSATQPESALVVNPGPARLREAAMWGITPFDQMWCRIRFLEARYDGPYTPPGKDRESIVYPGMFGGVEWGGLAVDPVRHVLIANPSAMPFRVRMARTGMPTASATGLVEVRGTGYSVSYFGFLGPLNVPCMQPPWGGLYAIDLDSQQVLWRRPVGSAVDSGPFGIASHLPLLIGTPQVGGTIITRSGLIFSAATLDQYLRAYDIKTGRELWKFRLPAGGQATPMTYEIDGRQYVVIAAGGHSLLGTKPGDYVLAWALPSS
jgi:quinoprotein glucose dehydrogenase